MNEPKRLIVSEDNELGVALAAARRQLPDTRRLEQLAQRLAEQGVAFPAGMTGPIAAAQPEVSGFRWGLKLKVGIGIAVLGALGGAGAWSHSRSGEHSASVAAAKPEAARVVSMTSAMARPLSTDSLAAAAHAQALPRSVSFVAPLPVASDVRAQLSEPERPVAEHAVAEHAVAEHARSAVRTPAVRGGTTQPSAPAAPNNTVYVAPSGDELAVTELEIIKRARNSVTADPAQAYALTERSRAQFPKAVLGQERDFIAITALFRLGREQQARAQAMSFRTRYPRSAYLPQIERMLGEE